MRDDHVYTVKKIKTGRHLELIDPKRVKLYRQMLRAGERAPPLLLGEPLPDGRWQLFDGFHRLRAAKLEGIERVEVFKMIPRSALYYARQKIVAPPLL